MDVVARRDANDRASSTLVTAQLGMGCPTPVTVTVLPIPVATSDATSDTYATRHDYEHATTDAYVAHTYCSPTISDVSIASIATAMEWTAVATCYE